MEQQYNEVMLPGYEPWGYSASSNAGFIARVDALQKIGWLPAYADASGFAIGLENRISKLDSAYVNEALITSECSYHGSMQDWRQSKVDACIGMRFTAATEGMWFEAWVQPAILCLHVQLIAPALHMLWRDFMQQMHAPPSCRLHQHMHVW